MATVTLTLDGTQDKPYGGTVVTSATEQEFDLLIAAGAKARQRVQLYTDQDVYMSNVLGGTSTPLNCELIPGGSFRNIDVSGIQGAAIGAYGGKSIFLLAVAASATIRISSVRITP